MTAVLETVATLLSGGGLAWLGKTAASWITSRKADRTAKRSDDLKTEEHRDGLTFDLLRAAREEMAELRREVTELRGWTAKAAHIEEALDHIHALLFADGPIELRAASRRATAFLKRMRPDPAEQKGELRNTVQTDISASRVKRDAKKGESE